MVLWILNLQINAVAAYQFDEVTPSPNLEFTQTLQTELTQPVLQPTETIDTTVTISPSFAYTNTVVTQNSTISTSTDFPPLPILSGKYAPDQILVKFKRSETDDSILQCFSLANSAILSSIEELGVWVVQVPFGKVAESIASIAICPGVRYAEPNYEAFIADTIPSDPNWSLQYGLTNIRAPQGWDFSTGSLAVTIAIIDSGIDLGHPDLIGKIVPGYDFVNGDSIPQDDNGHGTHVAGIAAASGNNGVGIAGISWGARIMPVKVLNASGSGSFANVAAGITWAADNGAQVINLSLGGASPSSALLDAVNYAYGKGVIIISASGNSGSNFVLYPAHYPNVIAVAATDSSNLRTGFSNYGPEVDLVAPGEFIYSTSPSGYGYMSGTSMAAPYVAGLAAILRGIPGNSSPSIITGQMENTALDLGLAGWDDFYGYGLIQMDLAIRSALPLIETPPFTIAPELSQEYSLPYQRGNQHVNVTDTPNLTLTLSPTTVINQTSTFSIFTPSISETPEVSSLSIVPPTPPIIRQTPSSKLEDDWPLGCAGVLLILAGILLFWTAAQRKKDKTQESPMETQ